MKIIAIRGENLASLARPFDIPLSEGALAQSGLFAITGPTGSGKSTLLDALCLALYDQTPRYTTGRQGAAVGQKDGDDALWIKSNDVRQILSRGKANGWAEVDFIGIDGCRYRAHWSVRRARNRIDGRLQNQELSLTHLDGEHSSKVESGKKTEVLNSIEEKIGLSWDQFRRAVLLPQGDFAAFLKASPKSRSELLERLTGTEIYSQIGIAAFEKGKHEEQQLSELLKKRGELELLDDDALAELKSLQQQSLEQHQRGQQLVSDADKSEALAQQCHQQQSKIEQAHSKLEQLEQQQSQFEQLAAQLAMFDQVQSARPLYQERSRLDVALAELAPKLAREQQQQQQLTAQQAQLDTELQALTEQHNQSGQAWQHWQGEKAQAQQLQARHSQLLAEQAKLTEQITPLQAEQAQTQQSQQQLEQQLALLQQEQQTLQHYCQGQQELDALSGQWSQWRGRLLKLGQDSQSWRQLAEQLSALAPQCAQVEHAQAHWQASVQQLSQDEAQLVRHYHTLTEQEPATVNSELLAEQDRQWRSLARLFELKERIAPAEQRYNKLAGELNQLQQELQQWAKDKIVLTQRIEHNRSAHHEAVYQYQQAQLTLGLEDHRHLLRDEQPCPLCGSCDHPYQKTDTPILNSLVQQMEGRVFELEQQLGQDQNLLQRNLAWEEHSRQQQAQWQQEIQELQALISQHQQQIDQCLQLVPSWQQRTNRELFTLLQQLEQALQQGRHQQQLWQQWQAGHRQLQSQLEQVRQALTQAQAQLHHSQLTAQQIKEQSKQQQAEVERLQQQVNHEQEEFALLLPAVPWDQLMMAPEQFPALVDKLDLTLAELSQYKERLQQLEQERNEAEQQQQQLQARSQQLQASLTLLAPQLAQIAFELQQLAAQLAALLQGETIDSRHQRLEQAWQQARSALEQGQHQLSQCQTELAALGSTLTQLSTQQSEQQAQRRECIGQWSALLQQFALTEQQILALMDKDHHWRQQQQQAVSDYQLQLGSARQAITQAQSELAEYQAQQQQALALWQQQLEQSEFTATNLDELKQALAQLSEHQFELRRQWVEQEKLRDKDAQLLAQSQQAEQACKVWLELKEIIGSADGSRFRAMAQALTLAQLLGLANVQLAELAPRYRLQPTPGNGLDLQVVDGDMGEEIRAIESLSGGETFLVSLALALALSALTTGGGRIGSLFIDEGFGTLDPESLEMALSCLDALQAAGRQVGVISHVQTLVERIGTRVQLMAAGGGSSQLQIIKR